MAKPKRMSEIFASSSQKDNDTTTITATPPYSSEGPTLPIIGAPENDSNPTKKRKAQNGTPGTALKKQSQQVSPHTIHPSLYEPWTRLPPDLLKLLESQTRLQATQNIVPVVFSKNQNVKSGINRLKTFLGAYRDPASTIDMPDALKQEDVIIAVSAQGEGTTKLVGIVDMVRRIVAPSSKEEVGDGLVETWAMYTMLTSIDIERKARAVEVKKEEVEEVESEEEEEAFESMDVDGRGGQRDKDEVKMRKVPILTVWMTRKRIPAFRNAFGEQVFEVRRLVEDED
ncbi:hypothetical protein GGP41_009528 [Bipolaris sorokiniana]|uniref:Uncharacterized protein n=2 Tax=Cochliobolus sativus TaxID=45130 RepID=A0A8H6DRV6_COCSA|nr:uncharacterized protein COCSADRAFT_40564 [Bipolaris sorokiniana ND90Pr]EMD60132.1 hypothetical protein COCSADRAFT_40564 [Bipolaris sorokiniana ND90Pr]KAF5845732.1 hypothetical protein GGP41_009528 [Bipolaris sorokiniana]